MTGHRKFHNKVKLNLIQQGTKHAGTKALLDICCGRGGDVWKWKGAKIENVLGVDIHLPSVEEARKRAEKIKGYKHSFSFEVTRNTVDYISSIESDSYDVVSCQFGFHFFSKSEREILFREIFRILRKPGSFIGVCTNGDKIKNLIDKKGVWKSDLLELKQKHVETYSFKIRNQSSTASTTTAGYFDYQSDSPCEYFISPKEHRKCAEHNGFLTRFMEKLETNAEMVDFKLSQEEKTLSSCYFSFHFVKVQGGREIK